MKELGGERGVLVERKEIEWSIEGSRQERSGMAVVIREFTR